MDSSTLSSSCLGVISPYREQVHRLQHALPADAATVDGYQGQERDLIAVSTVRSNATGQAGFLSDHRRLNVAISRARFGTVVVGCAATLHKDLYWGRVLAGLDERRCIMRVHNDGQGGLQWSDVALSTLCASANALSEDVWALPKVVCTDGQVVEQNLELHMPEWFDWESDSLPLRVDQIALADKTTAILQMTANSKPVKIAHELLLRQYKKKNGSSTDPPLEMTLKRWSYKGETHNCGFGEDEGNEVYHAIFQLVAGAWGSLPEAWSETVGQHLMEPKFSNVDVMEKVADIPEAVLGAMDPYDYEAKVWQKWICKEYDMKL